MPSSEPAAILAPRPSKKGKKGKKGKKVKKSNKLSNYFAEKAGQPVGLNIVAEENESKLDLEA